MRSIAGTRRAASSTPKPESVFDAPERTAPRAEPLWPYLATAAAFLFVLDVALRRIDLTRRTVCPERAHQAVPLDLDRTNVGDEGMAALADMALLTDLSLDQTQIGDAGLAHLSRLGKLASLSLDKTRVTDQGLIHLAQLGQLATLNLSRTDVGDAGLAHLKNLAKLSSLDLSTTGTTDAGLDHLVGLMGLHSLTLVATKVSRQGVEGLCGILPALTSVELPYDPPKTKSRKVGETRQPSDNTPKGDRLHPPFGPFSHGEKGTARPARHHRSPLKPCP